MSNKRRWDEFESPYAQSAEVEPHVMCKAVCQKHPLVSLEHVTAKLLQLDGRVAGLRTKGSQELRNQLLTEMEGLAVVAIHDLTRLMWSIREGYRDVLSD